MTEAKSTKELKELLDLALTAVGVVQKAQKDGHIGLEDLGLLLELVPKAGPAVDAIGQIPGELADLSSEEAADVAAFVMAKLTIDNPKATLIIGAALKALVANLELVKAIKS